MTNFNIDNMKRLIFTAILTLLCIPETFAGKWDFLRYLYLASKDPDKTLSFVGFLIDLFFMCIPVTIIAGIASIIFKLVFDLDNEDTQKLFFAIGGILLAIVLLIYFL